MEQLSGRSCIANAVRIRLEEHAAVAAADLIFIGCSRADRRDESASHTPELPRGAHDVRVAVPLIEGADHADAFGIRRPHRRTGR